MSKADVKKIVKKYAKNLHKSDFPFSAIYLFGSHVTGKARKWSDIDVAVISNKLKGNKEKNILRLLQLRRDIDTRIEPLGFTVREFQNDEDPMVYEIRKTGIRIM